MISLLNCKNIKQHSEQPLDHSVALQNSSDKERNYRWKKLFNAVLEVSAKPEKGHYVIIILLDTQTELM